MPFRVNNETPLTDSVVDSKTTIMQLQSARCLLLTVIYWQHCWSAACHSSVGRNLMLYKHVWWWSICIEFKLHLRRLYTCLFNERLNSSNFATDPFMCSFSYYWKSRFMYEKNRYCQNLDMVTLKNIYTIDHWSQTSTHLHFGSTDSNLNWDFQ